MTGSPDTIFSTAEIIDHYLKLVAAGDADGIVEMYAEDATVEDPVGGPVRVGRAEIRGLYDSLAGLQCETELISLRAVTNEAAFQFAITFGTAPDRTRLDPIDTMVFDESGKITAMRSYWLPENMATE